MPFWNWTNNPPYAEEIQINQEVEQIQEILNEFKQLVPEGFVELGQPKKYWGSTEGLDKPLCERYTFKHEGKLTTLDITKELSDELKLNPKNNFCIKKEALSLSPEEGGITINNEREIFLRKSFTVESLKVDIDTLLERIEKLERELEKEKTWWDKWIADKGGERKIATETLFQQKYFKVSELRAELQCLQTKWGVNYPKEDINRLLSLKDQLVRQGGATGSSEYWIEWRKQVDRLFLKGWLEQKESEKISQLQGEITKLAIQLEIKEIEKTYQNYSNK